MKECNGKRFILNGELVPAEKFDNSMVYMGDSVYEVIRTVGGKPLFFNDHISRLENSVNRQGHKIIASIPELKRDIITLSESDKRKEVNLKIVFNYGIKGDENYLIYFIESSYPSSEQYMRGVKGILFFAERKDPGSKVVNFQLKTTVYQELAEEGAYEALLVNEDNFITEGSRSNIFFLKDDKLVTAPDEVILKGITRKHILDICNEEGIEVEFRCIDSDMLGNFDSVFMTGTSPVVLPFYCIEDKYFSTSHPMLKKLRDAYMKKAWESLKEWNA